MSPEHEPIPPAQEPDGEYVPQIRDYMPADAPTNLAYLPPELLDTLPSLSHGPLFAELSDDVRANYAASLRFRMLHAAGTMGYLLREGLLDTTWYSPEEMMDDGRLIRTDGTPAEVTVWDVATGMDPIDEIEIRQGTYEAFQIELSAMQQLRGLGDTTS